MTRVCCPNPSQRIDKFLLKHERLSVLAYVIRALEPTWKRLLKQSVTIELVL